MTFENISIGVAITLIVAVSKMAWAMGTMNVKVNTLWDFQLRRGISESFQKGIATMNSPITMSPEATSWMAELAPKVQAFYARLGRRLSDRELAVEIERQFGDEILRKVCIPNGLSQGSCLLIAMQVAKEAVEK